MTTALYRRYRPDTFQDVIGQEHVTAPLMAALRADRVTHAYLFSGPRGCGKTTSARILARCLNCERYPTDTPCGQCPSCRDLATGGPGSLDVVEIDAASHNGVDDARDLRERAAFAPARDRFKIFILDEAHMVTPQGFNALLKLVEEPPAHVKFIFATTEPEKVIGTIRSRTHHYPFRLVPPDVLEAYLAQLCQAEGVQVGAGVFPLVTRAGGGSVRDTLSVMDQLIGGAVDGQIDYQRAVALLGYTDTTLLDQCVDAIAAADGAGVFRVVDRVISSGHDPRRFVEDLLQRLRDLLVIALAGQEAGPALGSVPADQLARMEVQARTLGSGALSRYADMTAQALSQMVGATSPRLQLELLMARLLVPLVGGPTPQPASAPISRPGSVPTSSRASGGSGQWQGGGAGGQHGPGRGDGAAVPAASGGAGGAGTGGPGVAGDGRVSDPRALAAQIAQQASAQREDAGGAGAEGRADAGGEGGVPGSSGGHRELSAGGGHDGARGAVPAGAPGRQPGGAGAPAGGPAQGAAEAEMIRSRWPEVLDAAKRARRATWALVEQHAQPGAVRDGVFQILFTAPGLVSAFENGGHGPVLSEAVHQALGLQVECHGVLAGEGGAGPAGAGPSDPGPRGGGPADGAPAGGREGADGGTGGTGGAGGQGAGGYPAGSAGSQPVGVRPGAGSVHQPSTAQVHHSSRRESEQERRPQPASSGRSGDADEDPHPAPVGWGEVAPIGRAHRAAGAQATGEPGRSVAAGSEPAQPVSASAGSTGTGESPAVSPSQVEAAVRGDGAEEPGSPAGTAPAEEPAAGAGRGEDTDSTRPGEGGSLHRDQAEEGVGGLAPVRRLFPLPTLPTGGAASSGASLPAVPVPAEPALVTFSDGVPLPEEPGDPDGPSGPPAGADSWSPPSASIAKAMAAARAAAEGHALPQQAGPDGLAGPGGRALSLEEDVPSEDDEDAEEAGVVGLEVVKRILGATVLEDVIINPEDH